MTRTNEKRSEELKTLVETGDVICAGDQLVIEKTSINPTTGQKESFYQTVAIFVKQPNTPGVDPNTIFLATPTGLILFEAGELHKVSQDKAREMFIENLDKMLDQKKAVKEKIRKQVLN